MKKIAVTLFMGLFLISYSFSQELSPYIKIGTSEEGIATLSEKISETLSANNFTVLGSYHPSNKENLKVIAFTDSELKNSVIKVKDRGALAAVFKIGLIEENGITTVSYTHPEYLLRAYLRENYEQFEEVFQSFNKKLKTTFISFGSEFAPFGGTVKKDKLKKYHYKIMMPYFSDPIELKAFNSFEEGDRIITENLKNEVGNTLLVYKLKFPEEQVVVYGVGLENPEAGEAHFLPKIGESHVAALPYEIILQNKTATMLHGKYRIALHWPDLTMGTFMKIMSTPGAIEEFLENLCQ